MWTQPPVPPKKGAEPPPQFAAHVHCGQKIEWIKTALIGTEVGLGPGHIVLDGDRSPLPKKGGRVPPQFSAHLYCGQTAACIKKIPLRKELGLSPGDFVLDGDPAPLPKKEAEPGPSPIFGP